MSTIEDAKAKVSEIDEKIARLKKKRQKTVSEMNAMKRKNRTHRLIELGAIISKYLPFDISEVHDDVFKESTSKLDAFLQKHKTEVSESFVDKNKKSK